MKQVLRMGGGVLVVVCLFPPWVQDVHRGQLKGSQPLGHAWIFRPPAPRLEQPVAKPAFNPNFNPDAPGRMERLPDDPWAALPDVADDPGAREPDPFSTKGISVHIDASRIALEIIAVLALLAVAMTFRRKKAHIAQAPSG